MSEQTNERTNEQYMVRHKDLPIEKIVLLKKRLDKRTSQFKCRYT